MEGAVARHRTPIGAFRALGTRSHVLRVGRAVADLPPQVGHPELATTQIHIRVLSARRCAAVTALDFASAR